jgi:hypothetical protein
MSNERKGKRKNWITIHSKPLIIMVISFLVVALIYSSSSRFGVFAESVDHVGTPSYTPSNNPSISESCCWVTDTVNDGEIVSSRATCCDYYKGGANDGARICHTTTTGLKGPTGALPDNITPPKSNEPKLSNGGNAPEHSGVLEQSPTTSSNDDNKPSVKVNAKSPKDGSGGGLEVPQINQETQSPS